MKSALESNQPKKKGPYKRKAFKESNSNAYEMNGPSTRYICTNSGTYWNAKSKPIQYDTRKSSHTFSLWISNCSLCSRDSKSTGSKDSKSPIWISSYKSHDVQLLIYVSSGKHSTNTSGNHSSTKIFKSISIKHSTNTFGNHS
ncbi:uncharacterized protein LOC103959958 [Pyrus x bretschneideri]|uniref:uncharacterized protein LOC103959958 n=1 Tax=Pyrus x bretschneideri TaxID=225117 RepID=UPI00202E578C|nr:uncharacterized protein LOC103959958 [Pyrus x bretschneideri]